MNEILASKPKDTRSLGPAGQFATLFERFDEIRLINLVDRTDRLRESTRALWRAGLDTERHPFSVYAARRFEHANGFPSVGARGSFTSHREVLRQASEKGNRSLLVLEDDICFPDVSAEGIRRIIEDLETLPWDIVYFGLLSPNYESANYCLAQCDQPTIGGHFYGIREPYLSQMLEFMDSCEARQPGSPQGGPMFRDGAYNHFREHVANVRVLAATPSLGGQRSSRTDLHELRFWDRLFGLREAAALLRRLRNVMRP